MFFVFFWRRLKPTNLEVDCPFCSSIVLFKRPFSTWISGGFPRKQNPCVWKVPLTHRSKQLSSHAKRSIEVLGRTIPSTSLSKLRPDLRYSCPQPFSVCLSMSRIHLPYMPLWAISMGAGDMSTNYAVTKRFRSPGSLKVGTVLNT